MEEEEKDMGIEKEMEYTFIISKGLVILRKIAMLNCMIWKIKVTILFLKKPEMRIYLYKVLWNTMKKVRLGTLI
jgi:hypothetical protein